MPRVHALLAALALSGGCFATTSRPTCDLDPEPIADDVAVTGFTGADLAALVVGTRQETGAYDDGTEVGVTIEVTRDGSAEWVHTTPSSEVTRSWGFGNSTLMIAVMCGDYVRVPVDLAVTTDDGATDFAAGTYAAGPMDLQYSTAPTLEVDLSADVPLDQATVPLGADADPADYDDPYAFAGVFFPSDGGPTTGDVGWGGSQETEEYSSASAFYTLEW